MTDAPDPDWYLDDRPQPPLGPAAQWRAWWRAQWLAAGATSAGRVAREQGFVLTCADLRTLGFGDHDLRREVRRGRLSMAGYGVASPIVISEPSDGDFTGRRRRHALAATAAVLQRRHHAITGRSAAILSGLPTLFVPDRPEINDLAPQCLGRRATAHVFGARLRPSDISSWYGAPVSRTARTLVDLARHDRRDGLMAADAALREGLVDRASIRAALVNQAGWPGVRQAREVLELATPLAESPLESLTRLKLRDDGFPEPELQVVINDDARGKQYRVDMLIRRYRLVLEMDGLEKYTGDALRQEKVRETALRWLGYHVVRLLWTDVTRDWPVTRQRLAALLRD
jgi:hypothetical protein